MTRPAVRFPPRHGLIGVNYSILRASYNLRVPMNFFHAPALNFLPGPAFLDRVIPPKVP